MALLELNPIARGAGAGLSGQVGLGYVGYKTGGLQYMRDYVIPANPNTAFQAASRSVFAQVSSAWSLLDASVAALWNSAALSVTLHDNLGRAFTPSGKAYYQQVNTYQILGGGAISSVVPSAVLPPGWSVDDSAWDLSSNTLILVLVVDGITHDGWGFLRLTPPWNITAHANLQARPTDLRQPVGGTDWVVDLSAASPQTITLNKADLIARMPEWAYPDTLAAAASFAFGAEIVTCSVDYQPSVRTFQRRLVGQTQA